MTRQQISMFAQQANDLAPNQPPTTPQQRVIDLERRLADALRSGDRAQAAAMLTDDVAARSTGAPGSPVPRDEWLAASLASTGKTDAEFEEIAVHSFEGVSLVSFRMTGSRGGTATFVDAWVLRDGAWKLAVRYFGLN